MKFRIFAVVVLLASSLMGQSNSAQSAVAQASGPIVSFHSRGTFAQFFSFQNGSDVFLSVSRNGEAGQQATTFLNFSSFTFSSDAFTDTFAFGQIPNESLRSGGDKRVSLNVDLSQVSSFQVTTCTFSFTNFTFTCQSGPFGVVQVDWVQDGNFSTHLISNERQQFFQFTIHTQQDSDSSSASVSGSVTGIPVNNGFANIGIHHDTQMEFFKN